MTLGRLQAGGITGAIGALALVGLSFINIPVGALVAIVVGIGAGILIARNPTFAGKTGGAGALAGLLAGVVLLIGAIIATVITINSPQFQQQVTQVVQTQQAVLTATATAGGTGSSTTTNVNFTSIINAAGVFIGCAEGLFYLGLATGAGAAAGAIAGRNNAAPPATPYGQYGAVPPYGAPPQQGYPPQMGYPPQQGNAPPQSSYLPPTPYGSQQPPQNDGTR